MLSITHERSKETTVATPYLPVSALFGGVPLSNPCKKAEFSGSHRIWVDFWVYPTDTSSWIGNFRSAKKLRRTSGLFVFMGSFQVLPLSSQEVSLETSFPKCRTLGYLAPG
jgi:hypothetical protein